MKLSSISIAALAVVTFVGVVSMPSELQGQPQAKEKAKAKAKAVQIKTTTIASGLDRKSHV